jgi:hypothetical protein
MNISPRHRLDWHTYLFLLFITALSIWVQGYQSEGSDHAIHVVFVQHYNQPELYPNDQFVTTLSHYYSFFWYAVAYIVRVIPRDVLFLALFVIARFLLFHALFLLALELFQNKWVGFLACLFVIATHLVVWGGSYIIELSLDHSGVVRPLLLYALYFFLRRKWWPSTILLGVSFNLHPMVSVYAGVMMFAAFWLLRRDEREGLLLPTLVCVVLCLPMALWLITSVKEPIANRALYVSLMRYRLWHHLSPFSWSAKLWAVYGMLFLAWLWSLVYAPRREVHRLVLGFWAGIGILCAIGTVGSELWPQPTVLRFHLFRSLIFAALLAFCYMANLVVRLCIPARKELPSATHPRQAIGYFFSPQNITVLLSIMLIIWGTIGPARFLPKKRWDRGAFAEWKEIQDWARRNTPASAFFLTPPYETGFRIDSQRACLVEWKDGSALIWAPNWGTGTWWPRLLAICPELEHFPHDPLETLRTVYQQLPLRQLYALQREYGVDYCVTPRTYSLPLVYQSETYRIYQITPPGHSEM